jgi:HEAT repeat protein
VRRRPGPLRPAPGSVAGPVVGALLAGVCVAVAAAPGGGETSAPRQVKVVVQQRYDSLPAFELPLGPIAEGLLKHAGVRLEPPYEGTLGVTLWGTPLGANYSAEGRRVFLYTGAEISGQLQLRDAKGANLHSRNFSGRLETFDAVGMTGEDDFRTPSPQLFGEAFRGSTFARALGELVGTAYGVKPLVLALTDADADVRTAAQDGLRTLAPGWAGSEAAAEALPTVVSAARSDAADMRLAAIGVVREIARARPSPDAEAQCRDELLRAAGDPAAAVRAAAVSALTFDDPPAVRRLLVSLLDADEDVRAAAGRSLAAVDPDWHRRPLPAETVQPFLAAVSHADAGIRRAAVETLGRLASEGVEAAVATALRDPDQGVRLAAVQAAKGLGEPRASTLLVPLRDDSDDAVRAAVAAALVSASGPALEDLFHALGAADPAVRATALEAIGRSGAPGALPQILPALADPESRVRWAALAALKSLAPEWWKTPAAREAVGPVAARVGDPDVGRRAGAAWGLGELRRGEAVRPLLPLLVDPDERVRQAARQALSKIDPRWRETEDVRQVTAELARVVADPQAPDRTHAAQLLGVVGGEDAVDALVDAVAATDPALREAAAAALRAITGERFGAEPAKWKKWREKDRKRR